MNLLKKYEFDNFVIKSEDVLLKHLDDKDCVVYYDDNGDNAESSQYIKYVSHDYEKFEEAKDRLDSLNVEYSSYEEDMHVDDDDVDSEVYTCYFIHCGRESYSVYLSSIYDELSEKEINNVIYLTRNDQTFFVFVKNKKCLLVSYDLIWKPLLDSMLNHSEIVYLVKKSFESHYNYKVVDARPFLSNDDLNGYLSLVNN